MKVIVEVRLLINVLEVRSFLGLVIYCGKFILNLVLLLELLRFLMRKN